MMDKREKVLRSVREAIGILKSPPEFVALIPEVRTNIVEALPAAKTTEEVVGVPGRITNVRRRAVAAAEPESGGSSHVARFVLALMENGANVRAGINIKYDGEILEVVRSISKERGLVVSFFDRKKEPREMKKVEGATTRWAAEEAMKNVDGKTPHVIYDPGDWGKEALIYLFGINAVEVARLAVCVAKNKSEL